MLPAPPRAIALAAAPAGVAAIVAASAVLRTRAIGAPLWVDEGISVGIASHPLAAIPGVLRQDGSPPLYYLLLHLWMGVAGRSETDLHVLSLLVALACVPAAWWLARTLWGARAAWAAAALTALVPLLTDHAQEARMYPLVALFSLLVAGSFAGCFLGRRPRMAWLHAGALTGLAYTHNWFVFLGTAEAVALAVVLAGERGRRREIARLAAVAFGVPVLLYLPWVPTLLFQARHTAAPWAREPGLASLWQARSWIFVAPAALTALTIAVVTAAVMLRRTGARTEWHQLLALAWLAAGTLLLAFAYNQHTADWTSRYTTIVLGPLLLLCALALARIGVAGLVALALVIVAWAHEPPARDILQRSDVRATTVRLAPALRPRDLMISAAPETVPVLRYYLGPRVRYASAMGRTPDPGVMDWRDALSRLKAEPPGAVARLADRLRPGAHVVLFRPRKHATVSKIPWQALYELRGTDLARLLRHDPLLRHVRHLSPGFRGTKTTVRADVFTRVPGTAGRRGSGRGRSRPAPTSPPSARARPPG